MAAAIHPLFATPLPDGWRLTTVDSIKSPEKSSCVAGPFGSNISSKYFVESGVPVIRGSNLRDDLTRFVPEGFAFVSEEQATKYKAQHVRAGDLVFTCWGTVGQVGLIPANGPFPEYIISNKQLKLRTDPETTDPLYLFFYFAGPQMVKHVLGKAIGAAVPGINLGILKELPVVLPPLPVQRRIAGILSAYDELVENSQRRIRLLEAMARALYREWFVHFRFPGHETHPRIASTLGDIPKGWLLPFADHVDFKEGPGLRNWQYRNEGLPFLNIRTLVDNDIDLSKVQFLDAKEVVDKYQHFLLKEHDHVVSSSGTIGRIVTIRAEHLPLMLNTSIIRMRPQGPRMGRWLLKHFMLSDYFQNQAKSFATGAAQPNFGPIHLKQMVIIAPDPHIAAEYERLVAPMELSIMSLARKIQTLHRTRDLLLPRLLSGQVELAKEVT